jgi:mRNA interferase YafQ
MKEIYQTTQFKKDLRRVKKRGKEIVKLKAVVGKLVRDEPLDEKYRDHALSNNWAGSRDCHIEPDWVLIYRSEGETLFLERTGSHSDLFK